MACPLCHLEGRTPADAGRYVYRCSRCGGCYACQHRADLEHRRWRCVDGRWRPATFDAGADVREWGPKLWRI